MPAGTIRHPLPHPQSKPNTAASSRPWRAEIRWVDDRGKRQVRRVQVRRNHEPIEPGEMWVWDMPDDAGGVGRPVTIEVVWR